MKANDLMIGDWVCVTNSDYLEYVQVDGMLGNSIFTKEAEYESEEIDIMDLQPIPLTHEILEKNGWEITKIQDCKHYWHEDIPFGITIEPYNHWRSNEDKIFADDFFDCVMIRINYVHEIQHALKLCGIEKEIVL